MCFCDLYGASILGTTTHPSTPEVTTMNRQDDKNSGSRNRLIESSVPVAVQEQLLEQLLGTRVRDLEELEHGHRELLAASPALHRKFLRWLVVHEPLSPHIAVGLAILATGPDVEARGFVGELVPDLHVRTLADTIDYIHGWRVEHTHVKLERKRFSDEMSSSYEVGSRLVRGAMREEVSSSEMVAGQILVTLGSYDKVQQVLDALQLGYRTLPCKVLETLPLRADQVVIINCPGGFTTDGLEKIRRFVLSGGTLVTTDWALETTVQRAFPGTLEYEGEATGDEVVEVSWIHPDSPYTRGVEVDGERLRWWLEGASYPITVLDDRVTVLVRSKEMGRRYSHDPLVVQFSYGEGMVFHLTSHYYLQRSQGDKSVKAQDVAATLASKIGAADVLDQHTALENVSGGQLAAAYSSMRLLANILYERRRQSGV